MPENLESRVNESKDELDIARELKKEAEKTGKTGEQQAAKEIIRGVYDKIEQVVSDIHGLPYNDQRLLLEKKMEGVLDAARYLVEGPEDPSLGPSYWKDKRS